MSRELLEVIGLIAGDLMHEGENGALYHAQLDARPVVIKIPGTGSPEIGLFSRLSGTDGVIRPVTVGLWRGVPALILPLARGDLYALHEVAATGGLRSFLPLCRGLDALHDLGWLHRDIHPGNMLLLEEGWVLSDLGIAREQTGFTRDGSHGLLRFASLNQIKGGQESLRDDLFSLALTLHFAMTARLPWKELHGVTLFGRKEEIPPELDSRYRRLVKDIGRGRVGSAVELLERLIEGGA